MTTREVMRQIGDVLDIVLFDISGSQVTIATAATALLVFATTFVVSKVARRGVERAFSSKGIMDEGTVGVTQRLVHYVILMIGITAGLEMLGIRLSALFAAGAVFAVGVGFAMQNIAQNFVSGVILLVERSIKPGDVLNVNNQMVRVVRMGIRATVVRTRDEEDIIVPNSELVQTPVTNLTLRDRFFRVRVNVGVSYGSDMAQVRRVLRAAAESVPETPDSHPALVQMVGFGSSSVDWTVAVWEDQPWEAEITRDRLHQAVWDGLAAAGITIPFPQVDVHIPRSSNLEE